MSQQQKLITPETNPTVAKAISSMEWYQSLKKPSITPPQWAFPVVWTILYIMMAVSFYIYLRDSKSENTTGILLFAIQLVLNLIWTPIFFWKKMIKVALVDIVLLWFMILATIIVFHQRSPLAAYLLIPYILWVTVAAYLNAYIVKNNPEPIHSD